MVRILYTLRYQHEASPPLPLLLITVYNSLGVKLNSAPSGQTGNFNDIYLSTIDQLIIQGSSTTGTNLHVWTYNLLLKPLGYTIKPGSYNFTLLFTMTQP
jgi:hypothetical protein